MTDFLDPFRSQRSLTKTITFQSIKTMLTKGALATLFAAQVSAFPWVLDTIGQPRDYFGHQEKRQTQAGSAATCPSNPNHKGAVPISAKYPYCGAKNGLPGYQVCVNNLVPAKVS